MATNNARHDTIMSVNMISTELMVFFIYGFCYFSKVRLLSGGILLCEGILLDGSALIEVKKEAVCKTSLC